MFGFRLKKKIAKARLVLFKDTIVPNGCPQTELRSRHCQITEVRGICDGELGTSQIRLDQVEGIETIQITSLIETRRMIFYHLTSQIGHPAKTYVLCCRLLHTQQSASSSCQTWRDDLSTPVSPYSSMTGSVNPEGRAHRLERMYSIQHLPEASSLTILLYHR